MRSFLQLPRGQEVTASLQCRSSNAQSISTHAKHNSTASSKKRKSHLKLTISYIARAVREHFTAKRRRLRPSRARANFSPQRNLRLPEKNIMFRANPNIQIAPMTHENEAFVRGFLQIPKVEEVKTKLSCEASFEFQELT